MIAQPKMQAAFVLVQLVGKQMMSQGFFREIELAVQLQLVNLRIPDATEQYAIYTE